MLVVSTKDATEITDFGLATNILEVTWVAQDSDSCLA